MPDVESPGIVLAIILEVAEWLRTALSTLRYHALGVIIRRIHIPRDLERVPLDREAIEFAERYVKSFSLDPATNETRVTLAHCDPVFISLGIIEVFAQGFVISAMSTSEGAEAIPIIFDRLPIAREVAWVG